MDLVSKDAPLVVITGPTASGKTGLAVRLASVFNGEIISADSRAIYKYMDIGTAKPTQAERLGVVHWGFDLVEPGDKFSAADFKQYALSKIIDIRARGKVPFLVGGTGLYIDSVIFDYKFGKIADQKQRDKLMAMSLDELHRYCVKNNIKLPENNLNKRYVVRAIEQKDDKPSKRISTIDNCVVVGISTDRNVLRTRIENRVEQIFNDGVVKEAKILGKKYGWNSEAMTGNVYPLIKKYLDHEIGLSELKRKLIVADWRLAKRQLTWMRRNQYIKWLYLNEAEYYLSQKLADYKNS